MTTTMTARPGWWWIAPLVAVALPTGPARSQERGAVGDGLRSPDSVTVTPAAQYGASGVETWLLGAGYRALWTVPIRVEVARLDRLAGGLTPFRVGGGMTTRTLHMQGEDGKRYVLRSVDKYAGQGLDEELQGTLYESVLQDQISAFHPSGALVAAGLLDAFDILHVTPRLLWLPDDPRLGEYRSTFGGLLALFEERPDDASGFAGSRSIISTDRLFERLADDPRHRVHAREFLTARLLDLLMGDRDKSVNNWLWARTEDGDRRVWRPIPRDRDQAFIRLDGFLKAQLRLYEPRLVSFDPKKPNVRGVTRSAWDMDRPFLVELERAVWDSTVHAVQQRLTDSVIEAAVRRMPPEHYALVGPAMVRAIRARREHLAEIAGTFYEIVTRKANIFGTDEDELAHLEVTDAGDIRVRVGRRERSVSDAGPPYFHRIFRANETDEIRLYLRDGDDRVVVTGAARTSVRVRVIGGSGADTLHDERVAPRQRVRFYDAGRRTAVTGPARAYRHDVSLPRSWGERAALPPDWGHKWDPYPLINVNGDVGAVLGVGSVVTTYGFDRSPFARRFTVNAAYATGVGRAQISLRQRWTLPHRARLRLDASWSGFEIIRFHGFGNNTALGADPAFFRVVHDLVTVSPAVSLPLSNTFSVTAGPVFKFSRTDTASVSSFLATSRPYGSGAFAQAGAAVGWTFDSRDVPPAATTGVLVTGRATFYPDLFDVTTPFGEIAGTVAGYLSPSDQGNQVLALRAGAVKVFGAAVPFHEAAFLGGPNSLRGFRKQRFAGDAAVLGSAELRLRVGRVFFLFPGEFGVVGATDVGRVYVSGESPGGWHAAGGGGIWFAPVHRRHTVSAVYMRGSDYGGLYVRSGFAY